jgi:hypothetical protein
MRPTVTFSDDSFRSYSSLQMTSIKRKCKNRSSFCVLRFTIFDILTSTGRHFLTVLDRRLKLSSFSASFRDLSKHEFFSIFSTLQRSAKCCHGEANRYSDSEFAHSMFWDLISNCCDFWTDVRKSSWLVAFSLFWSSSFQISPIVLNFIHREHHWTVVRLQKHVKELVYTPSRGS